MRFAVSPLFEAAAVLTALCRRGTEPATPLTGVAAQVIAAHRLELLDALTTLPAGGYLPDFLTPEPVGCDGDVTAELHRVAAVPAARVRAEMVAMATGRVHAGLRPATVPAPVARAVQCGERAFAQRAADELRVFWEHAVRPHWMRERRRLEDDVEARSRLVDRSGTLMSLSPLVYPAGEDVYVASPYTVDVTWGDGLVLVPSTVVSGLVTAVDPCRQRSTVLQYRAQADPGMPRRMAGEPLADVLGRTRMALLTSLDEARTTAELASSHRLAPATVSYHLSRMHRAGLVSRHRRGRFVYYRRAARTAALLSTGTCPGTAPR